MSATYIPVTGQSLYDVCLLTYGSIDYIVKLATDNGITDLNDINLSGKTMIYDDTLVVNQALQQQLNNNYGTANTVDLGFDSYHDSYFSDYHN